ncbi:APC family permease [Ornithinimicrobium sp. Arc0846-15]|nr:APC family permease [Ornithinimicrobium laminariae]
MADKGLKGDSVGLIGSTILSISSVAPAYALTATLGILAASAGVKMPVVIIAGFLPMFFAAYAYREMNRVSPDCGTSFTWTTKAFGPVVGWLGGWTAIVATVIVLSNLAGVAVQFFYQFFGEVFGSQLIADLWLNKPVNVLTCLVFLFIASYVAYRGVDATERVQIVLVSFQLIVLLIFAVAAIMQHEEGVGLDFSWDWFSPAGLTLSAFIAGLSGSIFAFWGWDTSLTVNEESKDREKIPGRAAILTIVTILLTYLLVGVATQMYAGLGDTGLGLSNPDTADNVFGVLAEPVLGNFGIVLFLAVLASSAASLITTFFPTTRTMLGMSAYKALPAKLQTIHPVYKTPTVAIWAAGISAGAFYTILTFLSERVLLDTIYSIGIMICFYYGLTAFACIYYFRAQLFTSAFNFTFKFLFPLMGGLGLAFVFIITLRDSADPAYGSGAAIGGVGLVLILGLGLILVGAVYMAYLWAKDPAFFRGETLPKTTAETDTTAAVEFEDVN